MVHLNSNKLGGKRKATKTNTKSSVPPIPKVKIKGKQSTPKRGNK